MMNKKAIIFSVAISLLVVLALFVFPSPLKQASADDIFTGNITGWMWSSNIGWIKLGSTEAPLVSMNNGQLSGYAWSSNVGWIDFSPTSGYPLAPNHGVQVDTSGVDPHIITGWARACSVFASGCSGSLKTDDKLGGWDGWIKMYDDPLHPDDRATYNTSNKVFSGFAWGSLNLGWIKFNSNLSIPGHCDGPTPPPDCVICENCGGGGPDVTCLGSPTSGNLTDSFIWTADYTGPEVPTDYLWTGSDAPLDTKTGKIVSVSYSTTGTKAGKVQAMNGTTELASANCSNNVTITNCAHAGQPYGGDGQPPACCPGEDDTNNPRDGICGEQVCQAMIDEADYGIELTFGSAPLYNSTPRSSVNQKVTLSSCPNISITTGDLPLGASLICSLDQITWGSCSSLNGVGNEDYWIGVTSNPRDSSCQDINLAIGNPPVPTSPPTITNVCFRKTGHT